MYIIIHAIALKMVNPYTGILIELTNCPKESEGEADSLGVSACAEFWTILVRVETSSSSISIIHMKHCVYIVNCIHVDVYRI